MSNIQFLVEDNIPIPKREVEFGPRGSQYPLEQMSEGQSFRVPVDGVEGTIVKDKETGEERELTITEDAKKKASQKQSYFSSLGRKLGISVVTRYFGEDAEYGPHLRVWHNGPRTENDEGQADEGGEAYAEETGEVELD